MRSIFSRNLIVVILFLVLHAVFLFIERQFAESTAELIGMLLFLLLMIVLILSNRGDYLRIHSQPARIALRALTVVTVFVTCWAAAFAMSL